MADDYAKFKSQLDEVSEDDTIPESHKTGLVGRLTNMGRSIGGKAADIGTKALAGGAAAVQSASATSIALIVSAALGIGTGIVSGETYPVEYRDDMVQTNKYQCLDEYSDAYVGIFGNISEQPLPEGNATLVSRLREINEWSKEYVGQSVSDILVCDEPDCLYYGHTGCTDKDHPVKRVSNGVPLYSPSGARIDLANVKRIHSFFRAYGLTDVQIAAICGVMTVESHIDFTSMENYNIAGKRYNLDPSATTSEFGFKPWAEGMGSSPITTATCIHQLSSYPQPGPEASVNYASYSAEHSSIWKIGIGIVGFTDGPGFQLNTYLRNYADYVNDRVTLIERLIEGTKGWQEMLRITAASLYDSAYGAIGASERGTAQRYLEPSTGYEWKKAYNEYIAFDKEFTKLINEYNSMVDEYVAAMSTLESSTFYNHTVNKQPTGESIYKVKYEKHNAEEQPNEEDNEYVKYTTDYTSDNFLNVCVPERLKECDKSDKAIGYIEYHSQNDTDMVFSQMEPIFEYINEGEFASYSIGYCGCPPEPGDEPERDDYDTDEEYDNAHSLWESDVAEYESDLAEEMRSEHSTISSAISTVDDLGDKIKAKYAEIVAQKLIYDEKLKEFNNKSQEHAISVVKFYNALHDYYIAAEFDMEAMIRDASLSSTVIFEDETFYTQAAYGYEFNATLDNKRVSFAGLFDGLTGESDPSEKDKEDSPTPKELRLYYELWQNYAKYATNLPQNGKYINWWVPEIQMLYLVGASYRPDLGRGIKIRDEYRLETNPDGCPICSANITEYDTAGQYYYNWMSTWKGDDYTGRDITSATKNFFLEMISGGFDNGTLPTRTEYAQAYYYMFQYGTPYQQAITYASTGSEASKIMDEMIAEGRWQVTASNTLSDAAMPHNDKWRDHQTADITRQWEIDTSTSMSQSLLSILSEHQLKSKVNLLETIQNGCKYIDVIDNSTIGNAAIYLTDNPLIYADKNDKFYKLKYGDGESDAAKPVSSLYKVVYNIINRRLSDNRKSTMGGDGKLTDGFTFVKTAVLWSGLDKEFENITNADQLAQYLEEATSSIWQSSEDYQRSQTTGRGNTRIWEQRKLGPYYDSGGAPYYKYKWYLVPRVFAHNVSIDTGTGWYDGIRNDDFANEPNGDADYDYDNWNQHHVDEHNVNNMPLVRDGFSSDGYARPLNENGKTADWVRVDWECWDNDCSVCHGKGGHGNTKELLPGDIIIGPGVVGMWLGADTVQAMYPLEESNSDGLVCVGGADAQRLKSMGELGLVWSKPCASYVNHEVGCLVHDSDDNLPTTAEKSDPNSCKPYNAQGKWTVYRLSVPNYTDTYRSAGITTRDRGDEDWEIWYKYRYKGLSPSADTKMYLDEVRKKLGM